MVVCFAWLQMLAPLLHAHTSKTPNQTSPVFHFHVDILSSVADTVPTLKNINSHGDVVKVDESVIRDKTFHIVAAIFALLFILPLLARPSIKPPSVPKLLVPVNLRRTSLAPRAPPYF